LQASGRALVVYHQQGAGRVDIRLHSCPHLYHLDDSIRFDCVVATRPEWYVFADGSSGGYSHTGGIQVHGEENKEEIAVNEVRTLEEGVHMAVNMVTGTLADIELVAAAKRQKGMQVIWVYALEEGAGMGSVVAVAVAEGNLKGNVREDIDLEDSEVVGDTVRTVGAEELGLGLEEPHNKVGNAVEVGEESDTESQDNER